MKEFKQLIISVTDKKLANIIASKIYMKFGETVQTQDSTEFNGYRLFMDESVDDKRIIQIIGYAQGVFDTVTKPIFY
jgi:hypothetical protein